MKKASDPFSRLGANALTRYDKAVFSGEAMFASTYSAGRRRTMRSVFTTVLLAAAAANPLGRHKRFPYPNL
jgi:hypothetical protein